MRTGPPTDAWPPAGTRSPARRPRRRAIGATAGSAHPAGPTPPGARPRKHRDPPPEGTVPTSTTPRPYSACMTGHPVTADLAELGLSDDLVTGEAVVLELRPASFATRAL